MNKDFPRIITFLRKERGLSQKQVAGDMGISQALLSHYEKGIRECGLDFLVKTAEYYGVSTDYLLGRTVQRNFTADPFEAAEKEVVINTEKGSMINKINRSLLTNTTSVITATSYRQPRVTHTLTDSFRLKAVSIHFPHM